MNNLENQIKQAEELRKQWGASDSARDNGIVPDPVNEIRNIEYTESASENETKWHLTDIYYPSESTAEKYPVIVSIHGGGWFYGDKELYSLYCKKLASYGFAVINFNYRLSPEYKYPAGFEDVCRLMAFLKNNAEKYRLDTKHLYITGDSAGAQLAAQYSVFASSDPYRKLYEEFCDIPVILPARAALNCGIYVIDPEKDEMICGWYLPDDMNEKIRKGISEYLDFINKDFPESYIMCSVNDPLMPRSEEIAEKLKNAGVNYEYHKYGLNDKNDGHVFHLNLRSTDGIQCNINEIEFFRK